MLTFIGTILIGYLIWVIIKPILLRYAQRQYTRKMNDFIRNSFGGAYGQTPPPYGQQSKDRKGRKKKIFTREEGEYIEFEDIRIETRTEAGNGGGSTGSSIGQNDASYTPREPQVSDADWEEIR